MVTDFLRRAVRRILGPTDPEQLVALINDLRASFHQPRLATHIALCDTALEIASRARIGLYHPDDPIVPSLLTLGYNPLWHARHVSCCAGSAADLMATWQASALERVSVLGPFVHIGIARAGDHWGMVVAVPESTPRRNRSC